MKAKKKEECMNDRDYRKKAIGLIMRQNVYYSIIDKKIDHILALFIC